MLSAAAKPPPELDAPVRPGDLLADKYRVEAVLAAGGMGVIVAATHQQLNERVAVKFLQPRALLASDAAARFLREARALARIRSEHVARILDTGTLASGGPYMVMEFLDGHDLAWRLRQGGALPPDEVVELMLQACEGLAEAHSHGIIHRDLKPSNLFVTHRRDGSPLLKIIDFGIAKALDDGFDDPALTATTAIMGSPAYMSPEQLRSAKNVDPRTDVWSLGVCMYEMLTGRQPFRGDSLPSLTLNIVGDEPPPLGAYREDLPPALVAIVNSCLQKDLARRLPSVGALAEQLLPLARTAAARASGERSISTTSAPNRISSPALPVATAEREPSHRRTDPADETIPAPALSSPAISSPALQGTDPGLNDTTPGPGLDAASPARTPPRRSLVAPALVGLALLGAAALGARWLMGSRAPALATTPLVATVAPPTTVAAPIETGAPAIPSPATPTVTPTVTPVATATLVAPALSASTLPAAVTSARTPPVGHPAPARPPRPTTTATSTPPGKPFGTLIDTRD